MSQTIQWGVLGYARIARNHVMPAIQRSRNGRIQALAARDAARLAEGRQRFAIPSAYANYEDLLADPEIHAVYIPLPNALHAPWAIAALEAGKHVLCEKPLALNATEARRMADAARANGRWLMEAFMYRYSDRTHQVEKLLRDGRLGDIRHINASFRFRMSPEAIAQPDVRLVPELGGGALYDVGVYPLNFLGLVTGGLKPVSCRAEASFYNGVDMNLSGVLRYENGLIAAIHCGFDAALHVRAEIIGTEGVLEIPDTFFGNAGELILRTADQEERIAVAESHRYQSQVEDFADAILLGREPRLRLDESLNNLEVLDALYASLSRP